MRKPRKIDVRGMGSRDHEVPLALETKFCNPDARLFVLIGALARAMAKEDHDAALGQSSVVPPKGNA